MMDDTICTFCDKDRGSFYFNCFGVYCQHCGKDKDGEINNCFGTPVWGHCRYMENEWDCKFDYADVDYDYDQMIYVDTDGKPITGLLENYWYYEKGNPKNWQLVINGKRART